jgi:glyoxylase-like metal-dependent hydrolase (beta-lactamase superfamily II)
MVELLFCNNFKGFKIYRIKSILFEVCTYLIESEDYLYVIDPGKHSTQFYRFLDDSKKNIVIYITHEHFDHHYDLNKIQENFNSKVFIPNAEFQIALFDDRKNLSHYFNDPISTKIINPLLINSEFKIFKTPGHSIHSYCYKFDNYLFSGDTIIETQYLTFKLPGANKVEYNKSIDYIIKENSPDINILPGHGETFLLNKIK